MMVRTALASSVVGTLDYRITTTTIVLITIHRSFSYSQSLYLNGYIQIKHNTSKYYVKLVINVVRKDKSFYAKI